MRPGYCIFLLSLMSVALFAGASPAHRAVLQQQNPAIPAQDTARQRSGDQEKALLAAVTTAESGDDPTALVKTLEALARFYQSQNRKVELSPVLDRELAAAEKVWPTDPPAISRTLEQIAMGYGLCNERDRAIQIRFRIMSIDAKRYGPQSKEVASELLSLGRNSMFKPDSPDAENYFTQALAIYQLQGDDRGAASCVSALATLARIQKNPDKADALLAREIQLLQVNAARNALDISNMLETRANIASSRKDLAAAIDFTRQAMAIEESSHVLPDSIKRSKLTFLAELYMQRGDLGPAEQSIQDALKLAEAESNDTNHLSEIGPLMTLARLYKQENKFPDAEAALTRVMEIQTKARGADTPDLAGPCLEFAMLYATEGKNAQAETQYRRAISLAENTEGVAGHNLPETLAEYAFFLKKQNRNEEAEKLLQRAREIVAKRQAAVQNQTPQF